MSTPPSADQMALSAMTHRVAWLEAQAISAHDEVARLTQENVTLTAEHKSSAPDHLIEANQELVLSAVRMQAHADDSQVALQAFRNTAQLDSLTGIYSRTFTIDCLESLIADADVLRKSFGVLFIDLDNFKAINDQFGHLIGDHALVCAGCAMRDVVGEEGKVGRYGGDEFIVILPNAKGPDDLAQMADRLQAALAVPCRAGSELVSFRASIGASLYPADGVDATSLLASADEAMYRAKIPGRPVDGVLKEASFGDHAILREANQQLLLALLETHEVHDLAQVAFKRQNEMLAVIAHELRNPLAPIMAAGSLLVRMKPHELPRMQAVIEHEVAHLSRLIHDLLDLSRVNTGKLRLELAPTELGSVLSKAIDRARPMIEERHQIFGFELPDRPLMLSGDYVRLSQVFRNLLDNASKYTPEGGEIALSVDLHPGFVEIAIWDSGIGISLDTLAHVFDPFVQETRALGFNGSGLGIGLTVVRELVEQHGGTVAAKSQGIGRGSEFIVRLPIAPMKGGSVIDSHQG